MKALGICIIVLFHSLTGFSQSYWSTTPDFPGGPKTAFAGINDSLLFVGTANGIWKSENEGFSWSKKLTSSYIFSLHISEQKIVAGGKGKIFFSNNRGTSWDSVSVPTSYPIVKIAMNQQRQYFIIASGFTAEGGFVGDGVLFNNGDLQTWEQRNNGIPSSLLSAEQLTIDKNGRLYVAVPDENVSGSGGLYVSEDAGLSWKHAPLVVNNLGTVKVENTFSISITPQDSVIVSANGTAVNIATRLNLVKHINDVTRNTPWRPMRVRTSGNWWEDIILNEIHFAKNGNWYASFSASISQGGSFLSSNGGITWIKSNQGIGLSLTTQFERMFFYEDSNGKIFMTQLLDSRVYWTAQSVVDPVTISGKVIDDAGKPLMANVRINNTQLFANALGEFSHTVSKGWSGKIVPSLLNYSFQPSTISISSIQTSNRVDIIGTYTGTYFISGRVVDILGEAVNGVLIDGLPEPQKTNSFGFYVANVHSKWSGTITPKLDGYSFAPASIAITETRADKPEQNFTLRKNGVVYIKGSVKDESGVALIQAEIQGLPERVRINDRGEYVAQVSVNWSGTISASLDEYQFNSIQISEAKNDLIDQNFVGKRNTALSISGFVREVDGKPMADITINGLPELVKTNAEGFFTVIVPKGWSGTLIPTSDEHTFAPASISINNISLSLTDQNFAGSIVTGVNDENVFSVYPNPSADGRISIVSTKECELTIMSTTGQIITSGNSTAQSQIQLPAPGIYFVRRISCNREEAAKIVFR